MHKKRNRRIQRFPLCSNGGDEGIRTPGLLNAIQTRSQLRHTPKRNDNYINVITNNCQEIL